MCMGVSAGVGSSSFAVTLPQSPRLVSLKGPPHFRCSAAAALLRLLCGPVIGHGWPCPSAAPCPLAGLVISDPPCSRQGCAGRPCLSQGSSQAAPASVFGRGALPVCLQGQQTPTRGELWSSEVPPSAWRQVSPTPDYISYGFAYTSLENFLSLQMQVLAKFFCRKTLNYSFFKIKHKSLELLQPYKNW